MIYTLASLMVCGTLLAQSVDGAKIRDKFGLTGGSISFPITIVNTYPFISGEINGVKGKLMFDTGHQHALAINNNIVPLPSQIDQGSGQVGSGQKYTVYHNDTIRDLRLVNGLHFQNLRQISSSNYGNAQIKCLLVFAGPKSHRVLVIYFHLDIDSPTTIMKT